MMGKMVANASGVTRSCISVICGLTFDRVTRMKQATTLHNPMRGADGEGNRLLGMSVDGHSRQRELQWGSHGTRGLNGARSWGC